MKIKNALHARKASEFFEPQQAAFEPQQAAFEPQQAAFEPQQAATVRKSVILRVLLNDMLGNTGYAFDK